MINESQASVLQPLVAKLRSCPSRNTRITAQLASEAWDQLRREGLRPPNKPSPAVMAALVINNPLLGQLLTPPEQAQLLALAKVALDRYGEQTNPRNKLGNLIAGIIKEQS